MQRDVWKENTEKKALDRIVCRWQFHGGQRIMEEKEFQRHCDEVYVDPEQTIEVLEERIEKFKREGDRHFTEDGRGADITLGLSCKPEQKCWKTRSTGQKMPQLAK